MINVLEYLVQYGIAGIALYMMYDIAHNHLKNIAETLERIEDLLHRQVFGGPK